jgi:hypothetical protein
MPAGRQDSVLRNPLCQFCRSSPQLGWYWCAPKRIWKTERFGIADWQTFSVIPPEETRPNGSFSFHLAKYERTIQNHLRGRIVFHFAKSRSPQYLNTNSFAWAVIVNCFYKISSEANIVEKLLESSVCSRSVVQSAYNKQTVKEQSHSDSHGIPTVSSTELLKDSPWFLYWDCTLSNQPCCIFKPYMILRSKAWGKRSHDQDLNAVLESLWLEIWHASHRISFRLPFSSHTEFFFSLANSEKFFILDCVYGCHT